MHSLLKNQKSARIMMKKNNLFLLFLKKISIILIFCLILVNVHANKITISGIWKTIDDKTHEPRSVIVIKKTGKFYQGSIKKIFYRPGEGPTDRCEACPGTRHNQLILGMNILWNLKFDGESWFGKIIDPKNGKTYQCKLHLDDTGNKLMVRGYIGLPILGRTQIWYREP